MGAPPAEGFPKRLLRREALFPTPPFDACVPRIVIFPRVVPGECSVLEPLAAGEGLLRLVPDVLLTDPASTQAHLDAIGELLEQVECYELRTGADLREAAARVIELL